MYARTLQSLGRIFARDGQEKAGASVPEGAVRLATCSEEGCDRPVRARGLCNACYTRIKPPRVYMVNVNLDCAECDDYAYCRGLCKKHYRRQRRVQNSSR